MRIMGIDPGPETSGYVVLETDGYKIISYSKKIVNNILLDIILRKDYLKINMIPFVKEIWNCDCFAFEDIVSYGKVVGNSTLNTAKWVGRFDIALKVSDRKHELISRNDVKIVLCGARTIVNDDGIRVGVSDKMILEAVKDKFEPYGGGKDGYKGIKSKPGPLYGITEHAHSALALAVVCDEIVRDEDRVRG